MGTPSTPRRTLWDDLANLGNHTFVHISMLKHLNNGDNPFVLRAALTIPYSSDLKQGPRPGGEQNYFISYYVNSSSLSYFCIRAAKTLLAAKVNLYRWLKFSYSAP